MRFAIYQSQEDTGFVGEARIKELASNLSTQITTKPFSNFLSLC